MVSQLFNHVGSSRGHSCVLHGGLGQALAWSQSDAQEVPGSEISMFKYIILVHFDRNLVQLVCLLLAPLYSWENWCPETLKDLPRVTWWRDSEVWTPTPMFYFQNQVPLSFLSPLAFSHLKASDGEKGDRDWRALLAGSSGPYLGSSVHFRAWTPGASDAHTGRICGICHNSFLRSWDYRPIVPSFEIPELVQAL